MKYFRLTLLPLLLFLSSCGFVEIKDTAKPIPIYVNNERTNNCAVIDEVIGSEGTWYTFWFISNSSLIQGALNDTRNKADKLGANAIFIYRNIDFTTSVTFLGVALDCPDLKKN